MITQKGQQILGSFLAGNIPAYATHIALGCGPQPVMNNSYSYYHSKIRPDFEMFRVPITSRSVTTQPNGSATVILGAELPTENTYNITEVGIFSGESNAAADDIDGRVLLSFIDSEPWELHNDLVSPQILSRLNKPITDTLDTASSPANIIRDDVDPNQIPVFQTTINNPIFINNDDRLQRYENARFMNTAIAMPGNISKIDKNLSEGIYKLTVNTNFYGAGLKSSHIHLKNNIDYSSLSRQDGNDEFRLAFSLINKVGANTANNFIVEQPKEVRIVVQFVNNEGNSSSLLQYAQFDAIVAPEDYPTEFAQNRYFVINKKISELTKTNSFFWENVNVVKVFATVIDSNNLPSDKFYILLDGLRVENNTDAVLYGMTGYTVLNFSNELPVEKRANTKNQIQFRFNLNTLDPQVVE